LDYKTLSKIGWDNSLNNYVNNLEEDKIIGRIIAVYKNLYKIHTQVGEIFGALSGKISYSIEEKRHYPAVGDWVIMSKVYSTEERAIIYDILPRKSKFSRKQCGNSSDEQIIAANVDICFICMSLNLNFNLRRLERYITMAWESGASPVILLTKADICSDIDKMLSQVEAVSLGIPIHILSVVSGSGLEELNKYLVPRNTAVFIGSSGVGKSSLINALIGNSFQSTNDIGTDDKGRHTTTNRELLILPEGGIVIDTPGMREFHILDSEEGFDSTFKDIENLAAKCKFSNCSHKSEPGCAVKIAIETGSLSIGRFNNYIKLKKELEFIAKKRAMEIEQLNKRQTKKTSKKYKY
jgi:ribosome biogenesis GTPase